MRIGPRMPAIDQACSPKRPAGAIDSSARRGSRAAGRVVATPRATRCAVAPCGLASGAAVKDAQGVVIDARRGADTSGEW